MLIKVYSKSKLTVRDKSYRTRDLEGLLICHYQLLYTDHQERKGIGTKPIIILSKGMTDGHIAPKTVHRGKNDKK